MKTNEFIKKEIEEKTEEIYSKASSCEIEAYAKSEKKTTLAVFIFLILFIEFLGVFSLFQPKDSLYVLFLISGIVFCCIGLVFVILMYHTLKTPREILAKRQIKRRLVNNPNALIINTTTTNNELQETNIEADSVINKKKKELQELKKLFDEGLITSEDYEQKKKQLLEI